MEEKGEWVRICGRVCEVVGDGVCWRLTDKLDEIGDESFEWIQVSFASGVGDRLSEMLEAFAWDELNDLVNFCDL